MRDDPTIAAVREARHRISESVDHDPKKLVEYYRQLQQRHRERLTSPSATETEEEMTSDAAEQVGCVKRTKCMSHSRIWCVGTHPTLRAVEGPLTDAARIAAGTAGPT
jgi:hypothetical protein